MVETVPCACNPSWLGPPDSCINKKQHKKMSCKESERLLGDNVLCLRVMELVRKRGVDGESMEERLWWRRMRRGKRRVPTRRKRREH